MFGFQATTTKSARRRTTTTTMSTPAATTIYPTMSFPSKIIDFGPFLLAIKPSDHSMGGWKLIPDESVGAAPAIQRITTLVM